MRSASIRNEVWRTAWALGCALSATPAALGQQATNVPAALQPGQGSLIYRPQAFYFSFDDDRPGGLGEVDMLVSSHAFAYGVAPELTLIAEVPLVYVDTATPDDDDFGVGDIDLTVQWRLLVDDPAPLETRRVVLIGGVEAPSFDDGFSSESLDPFFGVSTAWVDDRHAVNAAAVWQFNTQGEVPLPVGFGSSSDESLALDAAYLYRIDPASFAAGGTTSAFFQAQLLGRYETGGDAELIAAPGFIYNGPTWAVEAAVQVPLWQDIDGRAELVWGINVGLRLLF